MQFCVYYPVYLIIAFLSHAQTGLNLGLKCQMAISIKSLILLASIAIFTFINVHSYVLILLLRLLLCFSILLASGHGTSPAAAGAALLPCCTLLNLLRFFLRGLILLHSCILLRLLSLYLPHRHGKRLLHNAIVKIHMSTSFKYF